MVESKHGQSMLRQREESAADARYILQKFVDCRFEHLRQILGILSVCFWHFQHISEPSLVRMAAEGVAAEILQYFFHVTSCYESRLCSTSNSVLHNFINQLGVIVCNWQIDKSMPRQLHAYQHAGEIPKWRRKRGLHMRFSWQAPERCMR